MADTIRTVSYYKAYASNRPGQGAKVLTALRDAKVNLLAFTGFPRGQRAQMDFVPESAAGFKKAAKKLGLRLGVPKKGFLVQGRDRVGAIAEILAKLAQAKINVTAVDAVSAGQGRYGAIFWVKPKHVAKAARILGAS